MLVLRHFFSSKAAGKASFSSVATATATAAATAGGVGGFRCDVSSPPVRIGIFGGGINGLSLAHFLSVQKYSKPVRIILLEAQPRTGGWLNSQRINDTIFECGPHSFFSRRESAALLTLINQITQSTPGNSQTNPLAPTVDLKNEIVGAAPGVGAERYVWNASTQSVTRLPSFSLSAFTSPFFFPILSALWYDFTHPSTNPNDESVEDFSRRRFGNWFTENLIDPMMAGIYSGRTSNLSVRSCFASAYKLEHAYGSILRGVFHNIFGSKSYLSKTDLEKEEINKNLLKELPEWIQNFCKKNPIFSFKNGVETLTHAITESLETKTAENISIEIRKNSKIEALQFREKRIDALVKESSEKNSLDYTEQFDYVFSTLSSHALANVLDLSRSSSVSSSSSSSSSSLSSTQFSSELDSVLSDLISIHRQIKHASIAMAHVGWWNRHVLPKDFKGFGLLVPSNARMEVLGITCDSLLFPTQTPSASSFKEDAHTRLSIFLGGDRHTHLFDRHPKQIEELVYRALSLIFNINERPDYFHLKINEKCLPQYAVGHEERRNKMEKLNEKLSQLIEGKHNKNETKINEQYFNEGERLANNRLIILGNSWYGVGMNDLISSAHRTAAGFASVFNSKFPAQQITPGETKARKSTTK